MVVPEASINNIMGGLESTAGVRLHNHRRKLKQRFDIVRKLGQGTYGKVQLGINKETGQEVAIKTIKKCKIETEADLIRIRREIQIMSSVQHPNIIHIYEVFENREKMVLVMEYAAGGELYDFLSERKVLSEDEARRIFRQIATAVYYCHKHKICHRDLKLENVLLDENGSAKIADFGLSNVFDDCHLLGTFCGSPLYASPEIVKGTPYHGPEVDCWSLGVLLYTLVYGAMPFDGSNFKRLVRQISQGDYFEPKKPSPASPLIREMLNVKPNRRADITAICSHWWVDQDQSEPCLELAEELANQTPVRLDLLLSLAPSACADKLLIPEQGASAEDGAVANDRPLRSQSLGSLATTCAQLDFIPEVPQLQAAQNQQAAEPVKSGDGTATVERRRKDRSRSKRRERSSSRSRKRDESTPEPDSVSESKPHRKSTKSRKKLEDASSLKKQASQVASSSDAAASESSIIDITAPRPVPEPEEQKMKKDEDDTIPPQPESPKEEVKPSEETTTTTTTKKKEKKEKKPVEKLEQIEKKMEKPAEDTTAATTSSVNEDIKKPNASEQTTPEEVAPVKEKSKSVEREQTVKSEETKPPKKEKEVDEEKPSKPIERRKSKIFETAEKFNNAPEPVKPPQKKVFLPGVKVSDAKKAYERKSSLASSTSFVKPSISRRNSSAEPSSPSTEFDRKFSLASTVALNKLVEDVEKLSKQEEEKAKQEREKETTPAKNDEEITTNKEEVTKRLPEDGKTIEKPSLSESIKTPDTTPIAEKSASPPEDQAKSKKLQNAVQVISNAIADGGSEKKAATLPRRKTSRAEIKLAAPKSVKPEFRSEVEHMVAAAPSTAGVQRSEVVFPVAAATVPVRSATVPPQTPPPKPPTIVKQDSLPREHIIPIQVEHDVPKPQQPAIQKTISRTNSQSLSRQSTADSDSGSVISQGEPIRKSPREVIIPIAVEGGGYVTPNVDAVTRMSSLTESEDESSSRGFGLRSTRRNNKHLDTADSISSDEDDDNFEILTAENLFSTLLSRVRNLTHRLNTEENRPAGFPRLFNHHSLFENSPSRRLSEARSFSRTDVPWRRSMSRESSSTLPRVGFRVSVHAPSQQDSNKPIIRRVLSQRSSNESGSKLPQRSPSLRSNNEKPPLYRPKYLRTVSDTATDLDTENRNTTRSELSDVRESSLPENSSPSPRQSTAKDDNRIENPSLYSLMKSSEDKLSYSSNSDLSDSYKTAKNSRSVSLEKSSEIGIAARSSGVEDARRRSVELKTKNSFSDLSEISQSSDSKSVSVSKSVDESFRRERKSAVGSSLSSSESRLSSLNSTIPKLRRNSLLENIANRNRSGVDLDSLRKDYRLSPTGSIGSYSSLKDNRSKHSTKRLSYVDGHSSGDLLKYSTLGTRGSSSSLRMRRHSRESMTPFNERITSEDIETFRNEFKKSFNTVGADTPTTSESQALDDGSDTKEVNTPSSPPNIADENLSNLNEPSSEPQMEQENCTATLGIDGKNSRDMVKAGVGTPSKNNDIRYRDLYDVPKYTKPDCPSNYSVKDSSYQSPLTTHYNRRSMFSPLTTILDDRKSVKSPSRTAPDAAKGGSNSKIPNYRRTVSLIGTKDSSDGNFPVERTSDSLRRSHSVTPDRSVLGKFFDPKTASDEFQGDTSRGEEKNVQPRVRKVSRFLRPDFYDTPREESVYIKNKSEKKQKQPEVKSDKEDENKSQTAVKNKDKETQKKKTSRVKNTIKVLRERSLPRECDVITSESTLIKRAVSLDDCSVAGISTTPRSKRASSITSDHKIITQPLIKLETFISKRMNADKKRENNNNNNAPINETKTDLADIKNNNNKTSVEKKRTESIMTKIARKISPRSPKVDVEDVGPPSRRKSCYEMSSSSNIVPVGFTYNYDDAVTSEPSSSDGFEVKKSNSLLETRLSKIAALKKLEFSKPFRSADSTPSCEDVFNQNFEDNSSLLLSPTEDNSDSWSANSDYMDARDFMTSPTSFGGGGAGGEESVSERIRRKSFYSRFNQLKKKKTPPSIQNNFISQRSTSSRLPAYKRSATADLPATNGTSSHASNSNI